MTGLREERKRSTRRALEDAALRLFARDGYEATSAGAIAQAAGVTERTFFRYFATKDEVLAPDREERQARLRDAVLAAGGSPGSRTAVQVAAAGLVAIAPDFEAERDLMLLRRRAAVTSPVLRGRLYDVVHTWQRTLAAALVDAGVGALAAEVSAEAAIAVWQGSITRWLADDSGSLADCLSAAFAALPHAG
ncbi:MAG: TetR family transcriptional regulator [Nocardioides sp.]|uniref:TetR family transcriptional regulator n=1 Tax=Nocardioides sp. TaxID=35761 RepID=UPI002397CF8C|nr:TetR family transcriptional regulator [Nocardioides sp.]MDE0776400.1 TetR family transcriptional regulator [Nocardioides sp.]